MSGTLNKVILIGNVGAEMKIHQFDSGDKLGRLPLATSESYMDRETNERISQTEWHNIVVRNKLVDIFEKYVKKGDKLYIEGKIKTRKWQDANNQDQYMTEIIVSEFTFLTPKDSQSDFSNSGSNQPSNQSSSQTTNPTSGSTPSSSQPSTSQSNPSQMGSESFSKDEDDDGLPF